MHDCGAYVFIGFLLAAARLLYKSNNELINLQVGT